MSNTRKNTISNIITLAVTVVAIVMVVQEFRRRSATAPAAVPAAARPRIASTLWSNAMATGHWMGPEAAPLKILEFSDFTCKYCAQLFETIEKLRSKYPDHVAVIYKHFTPSARGYNLALGSECAAKQGRFEQFHDAVFELKLSGDSSATLMDAARKAGVADVPRLMKCVESKEFDAEVQRDIAEGKRLDVRGTPALFVNREYFRGAVPLDTLERVLRTALGRE